MGKVMPAGATILQEGFLPLQSIKAQKHDWDPSLME
jgi:hypothetical protein